jgi:two-component system response regulator VicR
MKTILVIDDYYETLNMMSQLLTKAGYAVVTSSMMTPVPYIKDLNPSLIILDHRLHEGPVNRFCTSIKANPEISSLPVILLSADPNIARIAQASGAEAFIAKPFDIEHFVTVIDDYLYAY